MSESKENVTKEVNPDKKKKAALTKILEKLRNDISHVDELVTELEVSQDYKGPHYDEFCQSYTKALFLAYCHSPDDAELMLASCGLLQKLEYNVIPNLTERRFAYYQLAHGYNTLLKRWSKSSIDKMVRDVEDKIIVYLVDDLVKALSPQNKKLNFKKQMSRYLEHFTPRYLCTVEDVLVVVPPESPAVLALAEITDSEVSASGDEPASVDRVQPTAPIENIESNTPEKSTSAGSVKKNPQADEPDKDFSSGESEVHQTQTHSGNTYIKYGSRYINTTNYYTATSNKRHKNFREHWRVILAAVAIVVGVVIYCKFFYVRPVEEILVSEEEITLVPGEKGLLKYAVLPEEAGNAPLSLVSSDPDIVTVSHAGKLTACDNPQTQGRPYKKVDITIQAENGVTKIKTVIVNFAGIDPPKINEEVEAGFYVWQQVRIAGTKEWHDSVDAEVGDKVEFWIQYRNIGSEWQGNVMIRDILPQNLCYIAGTTKLWNDHLNGAVNNEDTITTTCINIGGYIPNANAHVRFQAEVIDDGLVSGKNTLYNWSQVYVGNTALQDSTVVYVNKSE